MRPKLENGKLIAPASITDARERERLVLREIERIDSHLEDRKRIDSYPNRGAYVAWAQSATKARAGFLRELELLREWMSNPTLVLFKQLYDLVKKVEADGCEFSSEEQQLIAKADKYFEHDQQPEVRKETK